MIPHTKESLLADLGPGEYGDPNYDRIDALIDGDPIQLGDRYRAALLLLRSKEET